MSESFEKLCIPIVISRDLMHSMSRIIMNYLIIKTKNKIDWPSFVHHCLCRLFLILLKVLYGDSLFIVTFLKQAMIAFAWWNWLHVNLFVLESIFVS